MGRTIATVSQEGSGLSAILEFFGNLHPLVVHFPIALVLLAAAAEICGVFRTGHRRYSLTIVCVTVAAAFSIFAAWAGWLNADGDSRAGTAARVLLLHRWIGIAMAAVITITLLAIVMDVARPRHWLLVLSRATLLVAALLVAVAGYLGGELVYGNGYLLSAFYTTPTSVPEERVTTGTDPPSNPPADLLGGATVVAHAPEQSNGVMLYHDQVISILSTHCYSCHGPKKQRGSLRLDQIGRLLKQQPPTMVIVPGDAAASELIRRVTLPHDDGDFMPASGEPLTTKQIDVLRHWINSGASTAADAGQLAGDGGASNQAIAAPQLVEPEVITEPLSKEQQAAVERIQKQGVRVTAISEQTTGLEVNASVGKVKVNPQLMSDVALLGGHVLWLSLGRTQVTDADLKTIQSLPNLQRLRLDGTKIGDSAMAYVASPKELTWLNIYDTEVSDQSIPVLVSMRGLRRVFIWDSAITEQGASELAKERPDLEIVSGQVLTVQTEAAPDKSPEDTPANVAQRLPACCQAALDQGGQCDHPCCVKARQGGGLCEVCKPAS